MATPLRGFRPSVRVRGDDTLLIDRRLLGDWHCLARNKSRRRASIQAVGVGQSFEGTARHRPTDRPVNLESPHSHGATAAGGGGGVNTRDREIGPTDRPNGPRWRFLTFHIWKSAPIRKIIGLPRSTSTTAAAMASSHTRQWIWTALPIFCESLESTFRYLNRA